MLLALLRPAVTAAGSSWDLWTWEYAAGDVLVLLPPPPGASQPPQPPGHAGEPPGHAGEPPGPRLVDGFVRALGRDLARYNRGRERGARLRIRVALRYRAAVPAAGAGTDQGLITAAQLLDEPPIRRVVAAAHGADLAVILSGEVFEDIIRPGGLGLRADDFCKVAVKTKTSSAEAWLHLPGLTRNAGQNPVRGHRPPPGTGVTPSGLAAGQRGARLPADGGGSAAARAAGGFPGPSRWGEVGVPRGDRDAGARAPHATVRGGWP